MAFILPYLPYIFDALGVLVQGVFNSKIIELNELAKKHSQTSNQDYYQIKWTEIENELVTLKAQLKIKDKKINEQMEKITSQAEEIKILIAELKKEREESKKEREESEKLRESIKLIFKETGRNINVPGDLGSNGYQNPPAYTPYAQYTSTPYQPYGTQPYQPYGTQPYGTQPYQPYGTQPYYQPYGTQPYYQPYGTQPYYQPYGTQPRY
jgi:hypothetical protein